MQAAFFAICFLLMVKTSKEYFASEIVIERPSLQNMSNGLVDGIRVLRTGSGVNLGSKGFECDDFNAQIPSGVYPSSMHHCECTIEASTFSFFDGKWKCVDNEELRQSEGKYSKIFEVELIGHYSKPVYVTIKRKGFVCFPANSFRLLIEFTLTPKSDENLISPYNINT